MGNVPEGLVDLGRPSEGISEGQKDYLEVSSNPNLGSPSVLIRLLASGTPWWGRKRTSVSDVDDFGADNSD